MIITMHSIHILDYVKTRNVSVFVILTVLFYMTINIHNVVFKSHFFYVNNKNSDYI